MDKGQVVYPRKLQVFSEKPAPCCFYIAEGTMEGSRRIVRGAEVFSGIEILPHD